LKNKCCFYVIILIIFFLVTFCNLLIDFPPYVDIKASDSPVMRAKFFVMIVSLPTPILRVHFVQIRLVMFTNTFLLLISVLIKISPHLQSLCTSVGFILSDV
jgi:hypothetical protein